MAGFNVMGEAAYDDASGITRGLPHAEPRASASRGVTTGHAGARVLLDQKNEDAVPTARTARRATTRRTSLNPVKGPAARRARHEVDSSIPVRVPGLTVFTSVTAEDGELIEAGGAR